MPIHYYDYEAWSGFKITSGPHVRYLSCREKIPGSRSSKIVSRTRKAELLKQARRIEKRLKAKRDVENSHKKNGAAPSRRGDHPHKTGVIGISLIMKFRKDLHYPAFAVGLSGFNRTFYITKYGYEEAWKLAIKAFSKHREIKSYRHLVERMPPKSQLKDLYKKYGLIAPKP